MLQRQWHEMLRNLSCRYSWNKFQQHTFQVSVKEFRNHTDKFWKKGLSRVSDIKFSNFLNVSWLIILTELPLSIRNSTGRALFNVNVVFANGLLIVKRYSLSEEFSFCYKLTGNFWGFDLQTAAKCPSFPHFWQGFPFAILHLTARWLELPQRKQHLLEELYIRLHNNRLLFDKFRSLGFFDNFFSCKIGFLQ